MRPLGGEKVDITNNEGRRRWALVALVPLCRDAHALSCLCVCCRGSVTERSCARLGKSKRMMLWTRVCPP